MKPKVCKDCLAAGRPLTRPAPHPGPRCATDHRAFRQATKDRAHEAMVARTYGLAPGQYEALYEAQGGRCAVDFCRATGKSKKLAVDHDHKTGEVRGLLCRTHNLLIGYNQDRPEVFDSLAEYLRNPPARRVLDQGQHVGVSSSDYQ